LESHEEPGGKAKSGGGVKAQPRYAVENLRELKAQEGIEARSDVKHLSVLTDRCSD